MVVTYSVLVLINKFSFELVSYWFLLLTAFILMMDLIMTPMMTPSQVEVVKTSVTNNSLLQGHPHPPTLLHSFTKNCTSHKRFVSFT